MLQQLPFPALSPIEHVENCGMVTQNCTELLPSAQERAVISDVCSLVYLKTPFNHPVKILERVGGIGPPYLAWQASALPLCYTRIFLISFLAKSSHSNIISFCARLVAV